MKKIGIVFAMNEELTSFISKIEINNINKIYELDFYETIIDNNNCILVESGVGKVNAARTTQILIDNYNVDCVFNVGVAGGVDSKLNIGDIVIASTLVEHDFDITAFNHKKGYIPKVGDSIETSKQLIDIATSILPDSSVGVIASGDIFITDKEMSLNINKEFNALAVEMEGASIAHVCLLDNIPCLVIRSISDVVNNENKVVYEEFLANSSNKISDLMLKILEKIGE